MYVFFAFPFSDYMDLETGRVKSVYKDFLENARAALINAGHRVFMAHYREKWGKDLMSPDECTQADLIEMKKADMVIAFPGYPISGGVHIELGWASAYEKKISIFLQQEVTYSPLINGLHTITDVTYHSYQNYSDEDLLEKIVNSLQDIKV